MIRRAQASPTGWLLLFVSFGAIGTTIGLAVAWASGWPSWLTLALGAVIGLLLAWRSISRPSTSTGVATRTTDLSPYSSPRIRLRQFSTVDAATESVLGTIDQDVIESMGWSAAELDSIAATASDPEMLQSQGYLAISTQGSDDDLLGVISLTQPPVTPGAAWLGLWLAESSRGSGIATEAIGLTAQLVWASGLASITMGTTSTNTAMQRSFVRAGAELFDTTPHLLPDGRTVDSVWFRLDRPERA